MAHKSSYFANAKKFNDIALCFLALLSLSSATLYSKASELDLNKKSENISQVFTDEKDRVVIATGYGAESSSALRNAAENALKSVVGSYITSERLTKKRSVIADGLMRYTKTLDISAKDYTQGAISSIKIISAKKENNLFIVTAKVSIKPQGLRNLVLQLASDKQKLNKSFISQIIVNNKNQGSRLKIIDNLLRPIATGEAVRVVSEEAMRLKDFPRETNLWGWRWSDYLDNLDQESTFIIPFKIVIKDSYLQNLYDTLNGITDSKKFIYGGFKSNSLTSDSQDIFIGITDYISGERVRYGLNGLAPRLKKECNHLNGLWYDPNCNDIHRQPYPNPIVVKVLDKDNTNISSITYKTTFGVFHPYNEINIYCQEKQLPRLHANAIKTCSRNTFSLYDRIGDQRHIYTSKMFYAVINLPVNKLSKAENVVIAFLKAKK